MSGPLEGLTVLDLTRLLPGGYATLLLADLGADVIKIEEPGRGDYIRWTPPMVGPHSAGHLALNRNKRSITLNLKDEAGPGVLVRLAEHADVLIESFRPGVLDRLGAGYSTLAAANPRLIHCAITGYGQDGPRAQEAGHDLNYMAYSGALSITGPADGPPVMPGVQVGDLGGGAMSAVIAILAALRQRDVVGTGSFCDVSMSDGILSWLSLHAAHHFATGEVPGREGLPLNGAFPCYRIYRAKDGHLSVGALEPQFWNALCDAINRPDLQNDAYAGGQRRAEVIAELDALFSERTRAEWMEVFGARDVCVAPVNDFAEAFDDEQARSRGMVIEQEIDGVGPWRLLGNPVRVGEHATELRLPPPGLGEHTSEVLVGAGFGVAEIEGLAVRGAI